MLVGLGPLAAALAGEAPVEELDGDPAGGKVARRILDEVNRPAEPGGRLERLTSSIPPAVLTGGLERAIDPRVLRRFGGPGLELEDLGAALNQDLRSGGRPHVTFALGILVYGGLSGAERMRLPHLRLGRVGRGFGLAGRLPGAGGSESGFYLAPAPSMTERPAHGIAVRLKGAGRLGLGPLRLPAPLRALEAALSHEVREDPERPVRTRAVEAKLPVEIGRMRVAVAGGATETMVGRRATRVLSVAPSVHWRTAGVRFELRRVDLGEAAFLAAAAGATLRSLRVDCGWRQDPGRRRPPAIDVRVASANLMPYLSPVR